MARITMPVMITVYVYSKVITVVIKLPIPPPPRSRRYLNSAQRLDTKPQAHESTPSLAVLDKSAGHIDRLARRVDRLPCGGPSKSVVVVASVSVARVPLW